ncbi:PQQ-dependent sugar dehydrogenase [Virgibacillus sp. NKC19-3]|uniref:PQQ-dependent sugar dehydrogenase n=1 Tax=Virgibacillus saliphilus TaxID=2831674 RepID=UPI001C9B6F2A|nr:PQQ-dependent sugar dehydrogenase [Virgibacillus sp. NKC19-3]MBY7142809.1 PQQ-dependent sugar dehydrogenase [Virgibacillus sp. NKC19-3]
MNRPIKGSLLMVMVMIFMMIPIVLSAEQEITNKIDNDENAEYVVQTITNDIARPVDLDITDDEMLYVVSIEGEVYETSPSGNVTELLSLETTTSSEHGLKSIALDPDFEDNGYMYLSYTEPGTFLEHVSRFTYEDGNIDPDSEEVLLEIQSEDQCCHQMGGLEFGPDGKLYISVGDNQPATHGPQEQSIETAQNLQDLRGKILRINSDGSIPEDNPFVDNDDAMDEIYAYGLRSPFKMDVDQVTGDVWVGDVGPDHETDDYDVMKVVREGGENLGWPYYMGDSCYEEFEEECAEEDITGSIFWYPYPESERWGSGGRSITTAGIYHHDYEEESDIGGLRAEDDGKLISYDFSREWVKAVEIDEDYNVVDVEDIIPQGGLDLPTSSVFGPDGSLYITEFGDDWWEINDNAGVKKLYHGEEVQYPVAQGEVSEKDGHAPLDVEFDASESYDPDDQEITFEWDFGDGNTSTDMNTSHTYTENGEYYVTLTVTNTETERMDVWSETIVVGNTAPEIEVTSHSDGMFFDEGDEVTLIAEAWDEEDGELSCEDFKWEMSLQHDAHGHPQSDQSGCEATYDLSMDDGTHEMSDNVWWEAAVTVEDSGGIEAPVLTARDTVEFKNKRQQAQAFDETGNADPENNESEGVELESVSDVNGQSNVAHVDPGDWIMYENIHLADIEDIYFRVASEVGVDMEVRLDSPDGETVASITQPSTGDWQNWVTLESEVNLETPDDNEESHDLYIYFNSGDQNLNWIQFSKNGDEAPQEENDVEPIENSAEGIKELVERLDDNGAFESDEEVRALMTHLTAISHYEDQEEAEKVVQHMKGFKDLLDHQLDNELISEDAFKSLVTQADLLVEKWQ